MKHWDHWKHAAVICLSGIILSGISVMAEEVTSDPFLDAETAAVSVTDAAVLPSEEGDDTGTGLPEEITMVYTYQADEKEKQMAYPEMVIKNEERWSLSRVTYDVTPLTRTYVKESPAMWDQTGYVPEPFLELDGLRYVLAESVSREWTETGRTCQAEGYRTYLEGQEIPETLEVEVTDPVTNEAVTGNIPKTASEADGAGWGSGNLMIPVTYVNYGNGSGQYEINGMMVSVSGDTPEFEDYAAQILTQNRLDPIHNRLISIVWDGDAYTDETGVTCRNAAASGDMLIPRYRIMYQGAVALPDLSMVVYTDHYESEAYDHLITATVVYQREEEHPQSRIGAMEPEMIAVLGLSTVMCILMVLLLLMNIKRKTRMADWR